MAKKSEGPCCVLTLPLLTEPWQEHILEKRFKIVEHMYNSLVSYELKKLHRLEQTPEYRECILKIKNTPKEAKKERDALYKQRKQFLKDGKFNVNKFRKDVIIMQKHFVEHIGTHVAQRMAKDVWNAFEKFLFDNGKQVHFKRRGTLHSVATQNASMLYKAKDNSFIWNGGDCENSISLKIKVSSPKTDYEKEMLTKPCKYLRVIRKWVKTRYKYYLQFTLAGTSVVKKKHPIGHGRVGIDLGTQSIAIASDRGVHLYELCDRVNPYHKKIKYLQQKMDASRRKTNPDNFNEDGTIKRVRGKKLTWQYSNHYKRLAGKKRHLERKNADIRRQQHYELVNEILNMGDEIYIEEMNYKALQKRAKETTVNKKGRYNRKKRFGKSLANKAPATFCLLLESKLKNRNLTLHKVDTWEYKASQYDHLSQKYQKKKLSQRTTTLESGDILQRDLYSAFLLMNADATLKKADQQLCEQNYERFKLLHDMEIDRLRQENKTHLSSFGVA
ncbi:MAG: transposase [Clostridia bacterium]|nr:transposase [Clostridia bacterium]